jgi:hypothetical protein
VNPREAILRAARLVAEQGCRSTHIFLSARDYAQLEEHSWSSGVSTEIERLALTYQQRTTLLSQMKAMWRLASRRGKRFDAREWRARRQGGA